jgi:hypothetical protein
VERVGAVAETEPAIAAASEPARAPLALAGPLTPTQALALQRRAGNAAVSQLVQRKAAAPTPAEDDIDFTTPDLAPLDKRHPKATELLQMKLNWHLGFDGVELLLLDGSFGPRTLRAVQAFQKAHGIKPASGAVKQDTWAALAEQPHARAGADSGVKPEYDKLDEDGLLEITLAEGYDEVEWQFIEEVKEILYGLVLVRGFTLGGQDMMDAYERAARKPPTGGTLLFKANVGTSQGRPVHCVVNLVSAVNLWTGQTYDKGRGQGKELKEAAMQGMHGSDLFIYDGHGRYGTGPDFDRNWWITVDWDAYATKYKKVVKRDGKLRVGKEELTDPYQIHLAEQDLGLHGKNPKGRFGDLERDGIVEFHGVSAGNVGISAKPNSEDLHAWLQARAAADENDLSDSFAGDEERAYRLWLFNGCNTFNYEKRIREKGGALGTKKLDMFMTQKEVLASTTAEALLSYVDGVIAHESAKALEGRMEEAQSLLKTPYGQYGFEDNPGAPPAKVKPKAKDCTTGRCQL